jgi:hypothetical protein
MSTDLGDLALSEKARSKWVVFQFEFLLCATSRLMQQAELCRSKARERFPLLLSG